MRSALLIIMLVMAPPLLGHPGASTTIDHFTHEIEHRPDSQALYIKRGIAYSADGQYERALADFTRAQSLGNPVLVSFDLGVLHYRRGELDTALNCFNAWLAQFPNHTGGLEYRARLLRDKGDYPASVADFRRVFELQDRPNPGHYISVAEMLASSGDAGVPQALDLLDAGNEKLGLTPQLQFYAIRLETGRGRPDLAVRRMLPKTKMGSKQLTNLRVYAGAEHPHAAQQPKVIEL